jgi:hypothetical protein
LSLGGKQIAYGDEARKKLLRKINRIADNLGVNEVIAAAVPQHLKTIGEIPAVEPGEADGGRGHGGDGPCGFARIHERGERA